MANFEFLWGLGKSRNFIKNITGYFPGKVSRLRNNGLLNDVLIFKGMDQSTLPGFLPFIA
jgi:hypothetical protein